MIGNRKEFLGGCLLLSGFMVVLIIIFSPVFKGQNGLEYLDALYNSISKGSAYYIPKAKEDIGGLTGRAVEATLGMADEKQAEQTALLFKMGGASATFDGASLRITGDLGKILENTLADADMMYHNRGKTVSQKYGYNERQVLYNWWNALKAMDNELKSQEKFKEAKAVAMVMKKAVEPSYNYYGVVPQKISERLGIVIFSLVFYVIYTLWYGFAVLFMFEGWGLRLEH